MSVTATIKSSVGSIFAPDNRTATAVAALIAFLIIMMLVLQSGMAFFAWRPSYAPAWAALLFAGAGLFYWVRYDSMEVYARRFLRGAAVFFAFFFLTEPFAIPYVTQPETNPGVIFHEYGRWLGFAFAAAAWFRPAAVFPAAVMVWLLRMLNYPLTGFQFSLLDIRIVAEVMAFSSAGFTLAAAAQNRFIRERLNLGADFGARATVFVLAIAIGAHLGNYFHSAVAKIMLDGGPLSWIFGNRLYEGMLGAIEIGTFPFAASSFLTQNVYDAVKAVNIPLQIFSFIAQLLAIAAVARRKWVIAITLVFDLFHVAVYVTFGLLFWKWIALNTIIVATLAALPDSLWTRNVKIAAGLTVVFGMFVFTTAKLAWYDSPGFSSPFFEAETSDGTRYRVPSSFFQSASYQISQGKIWFPDAPGHFNKTTWGSYLSHDDLFAGRACAPPERENVAAKLRPPSKLGRYVWANHARALKHADKNGRAGRRFYIHHHFPSPFLKRPFDAVDLREVTAYHVVVESVCLSLENGRLKRDVIKRTEAPLPQEAL